VNLDEELLSAWSSLVPPPRWAITEHVCFECEEIQDFFAGRPWTEFDDIPALRYHSDALHLFAPLAFVYYLPAFIRATLRDSKSADLIPDTIVRTIELEFGNASRGRLELLTSSQRAVLAHFLRALPQFDLAFPEDVTTLAELLDP